MEDTSLVGIFLSHEGRVSGKWEHYLGIYQAELSRFVELDRPVRLLEVGVQNGGSLEIWSKYFPVGSTIIGIDIDPACAGTSLNENITILIADASDPTSVSSALGEQLFDVIIDDGSHRSSDIIATFRCCFPRLEQGGIYIIEGLRASYWPSMGGGFRHAGTAIEWLKNLVDALNGDHFDDNAVTVQELDGLQALNAEICRVALYDSLAVIEKRLMSKSRPYRRFLTGEQANIWQPFKVIASQSKDAAGNFLLSDSASRAMNVALLDQLSTERADKRALIDQLSGEKQALIDQLSAEREDNRTLRASLNSKEARLAKLRFWLGQTGRMLYESRARVDELGSTLHETVEDLAKARTKVDELSRELSESRARVVDEVSRELSSTHALLYAIYASTSWRMTAPLRWLGNHCRNHWRDAD